MIIDRLSACDVWRSRSDCEWTRTLSACEGYDREHVRARAEAEGSLAKLLELEEGRG